MFNVDNMNIYATGADGLNNPSFATSTLLPSSPPLVARQQPMGGDTLGSAAVSASMATA